MNAMILRNKKSLLINSKGCIKYLKAKAKQMLVVSLLLICALIQTAGCWDSYTQKSDP